VWDSFQLQKLFFSIITVVEPLSNRELKKKKVEDGLSKFCRSSRESLKKWLPAFVPRWAKNQVPNSQLEDLKLFADATLKRLGDEYFLYVRSNTSVRKATDVLSKNSDWKDSVSSVHDTSDDDDEGESSAIMDGESFEATQNGDG
jgi:hypothetical protein